MDEVLLLYSGLVSVRDLRELVLMLIWHDTLIICVIGGLTLRYDENFGSGSMDAG